MVLGKVNGEAVVDPFRIEQVAVYHARHRAMMI
jgi:hypothetical protein